jgi:hypothetical protein
VSCTPTTIPEIRRPAVTVQLCRTHRNRLRKFGDVQADKPIREVSGEGYLDRGYLVVPVPPALRHLASGDHAMAEHRFVMAQHLGWALPAAESVHHINGNRLDNRFANLELWSLATERATCGRQGGMGH